MKETCMFSLVLNVAWKDLRMNPDMDRDIQIASFVIINPVVIIGYTIIILGKKKDERI